MYAKKRDGERVRGTFTGDEELEQPAMARRWRPNDDGVCAKVESV
jgi:hypothetical protein